MSRYPLPGTDPQPVRVLLASAVESRANREKSEAYAHTLES